MSWLRTKTTLAIFSDMIFAILFFAAFVVGVACFSLSDRWWLGGVICSVVLGLFAWLGFTEASMRELTLYFGIPIVFLGSLFGAYIVQLRRAPDVDEDPSETQGSSKDSVNLSGE